jgi:hypothetical protein
VNGYNVLLPDSSRDMLPELALPAMDALQQLGHTPVTLGMESMAELYRDMRTKRHGGYELFMFYARDIVQKGNIDFALSFGLSGILEDPQKEELHYLPEEFKLPGLLVVHGRGSETGARLLQAGAARWSYTSVCCSSRTLLNELHSAGVSRLEYLPLAYSPRVFFPQDSVPANAAYPLQPENERLTQGYAASFAGVHSPYREQALAAVAAEGIGLAVFGDAAWEQSSIAECFRGGVRRLEELNTVYNASAINLDLPHSVDDAGDYVSARVVECLGSGGFLLSVDQPGLAAYAAEGQEIAGCRDSATLAGEVRRWLDQPQERAAIAAAGHARVQREAQWTQRLKPALSRLEMMLLASVR